MDHGIDLIKREINDLEWLVNRDIDLLHESEVLRKSGNISKLISEQKSKIKDLYKALSILNGESLKVKELSGLKKYCFNKPSMPYQLTIKVIEEYEEKK